MGFSWPTLLSYWGKSWQEVNQELKQKPQRNAAHWPNLCLMPSKFLYNAQAQLWEMVQPIVASALLPQSPLKTVSHSYGQSDWGNPLVEVPFSQVILSCVRFIIKNNQPILCNGISLTFLPKMFPLGFCLALSAQSDLCLLLLSPFM